MHIDQIQQLLQHVVNIFGALSRISKDVLRIFDTELVNPERSGPDDQS